MPTNTFIFNYYPAEITASAPLGTLTLDRLLCAIKYPKKYIVDIFKKIRIAEEVGDMKLKNDLKIKLYSFTPCVLVNESRKYSEIKNWTGLLVLDFDHLPTVEYATEFKQELFKEYKFIIAAWTSPSKHGVKAFVKIPICYSVGEFKEFFNAIHNELSQYAGWDKSPQNCILPLFLSYDKDLLQREDYTEWTQKYIAPEPPPVHQYVVTDKTNVVEKIISTKIDRILINGHPQLRAIAFLLGGYVGGGCVDSGYALQMIKKMIDGNRYLSQKPATYKKTAATMIIKGMRKPLYLK